MSERPLIDAAPHRMQSAAELLAARVRGLLARRLAWLEAEPAGPDLIEGERAWQIGWDGSEIAACDHLLAGPEGHAWTRLVELFSLDTAEANLLSMAVAVAVEPALGPLIALAQRAEGRLLPTEPLVKRIFGHPPGQIWRPTRPLAMWGLVVPVRGRPGEALAFEADPCIVDWLFGRTSLDSCLTLVVDKMRPGALAPEWPVRETARRLDAVLRSGSEGRVVVEARSGAGRRTFGALVARDLGRVAVVVDPVPLGGTEWPDRFMRVQRFALFAEVAVIWRPGTTAWPGKIPLAPIQVVCVAEGDSPPVHDASVDLTLTLPEPGIETKAAVWRALRPELAEGAERLVATPALTLGDLEATSLAAPGSVEEASDHLRARARVRMKGTGRVIDPVYDWDDLVLAPDVNAALKAITFEVRSRPAVLSKSEAARLFRSAAGLSVLFSGPPGVGKSMAAQVIARDLRINLMVVDLAATTSKYIGETAKNLSAAFAQARSAGAALIFDEADALFARRTEVRDSNDRYANADTNHLLQLIEEHEGLVILSTNRRQNIDPAFIRRLRRVVEFPKPGPVERLELLTRMLAVLDVDEASLVGSLDRLAASHDLSPAQIKSAVLTARYTALAADRAVTFRDLATAADQEMTKEGRPAPVAGNRTNHRTRRHAHV